MTTRESVAKIKKTDYRTIIKNMGNRKENSLTHKRILINKIRVKLYLNSNY